MSASSSPDVTVLGAGIVGICSALSLAGRGLRVRLIDRDAPGQATSYGNAGIISPWSVVPQSMPGLWKKVPGWLLDPLGPVAVKPGYLPKVAPWGLRFLAEGRDRRIHQISDAMGFLCRNCVEGFRLHLAGTGHEDLIRDSYYVHASRNPEEADLNSLGNRLRAAQGADMERIGAADLRDLEPALTTEFQAAILIKGQARALSPGKIGAVLAEKFLSMGGEIQTRTVRGILPSETGGWTYTTEAGQDWTPKLVLAMGVWSGELLKPLGIKIPMEAERGYHVSFPAPGVALNNSIMDMDMKFVASSMEEGLRVAGTAEFAGLDQPLNRKRLDGLAELAKALLPDLRADGMETWSGQRPSLPDSLPCIGEVEGFPDLIAAFGHSHYGLMMAPKTGRLVADIVSGTPVNEDLSPFRTRRYERTKT
ncbi:MULTISPECIES: NAD(P)/FAD-dependent oxidoreductase [unclassified Leisingera]|uniref:NAD(P)/FAD-dependent oxidoreductase n=1 Tax=unclassified Leisingera TaxID=2614906 RepID=UPI00030E84EF|nr:MULTISPECIES: FAD-dependent oxidoreductase [unclassified Leisingera]KIC26912.1 FAD-binding oxidoreductase [Leisingera sp. ANG-S3]KIC50567.1 FAD-binding oxidoreductase [Leisingera sp. ANG-S]KID07144.1 FAD-binding oxidoreductase [Leisingera sp. ANG1]